MKIHRKGQGRITRNSSLILVLLLALFSFQGTQQLMAAYGLAKDNWKILSVADMTFFLSHLIGLVIFLIIMFFALRLIWYRQKSVDFLIDVEGEMRKVVWPVNPEGRTIGEKTKELRTSSMVVVGVVIFMAFVLYWFDTGFSHIMRMILTEV